MKTVLRGKLIALSASKQKLERAYTSSLMAHLSFLSLPPHFFFLTSSSSSSSSSSSYYYYYYYYYYYPPPLLRLFYPSVLIPESWDCSFIPSSLPCNQR
jgi:hypothetical protein